MNYKRIHDDIISRAENRIYKKGVHHKHHIIPKHHNKNDNRVVILTKKEHYLIHYLLYKIYNKHKDKHAYIVLKNSGLLTKESKLGIFNPKYHSMRKFWSRMGQKGFQEWKQNNIELYMDSIKKGGQITGSKMWWNNGKINTKANECPGDGWIRGMLMSVKQKENLDKLHRKEVTL